MIGSIDALLFIELNPGMMKSQQASIYRDSSVLFIYCEGFCLENIVKDKKQYPWKTYKREDNKRMKF